MVNCCIIWRKTAFEKDYNQCLEYIKLILTSGIFGKLREALWGGVWRGIRSPYD